MRQLSTTIAMMGAPQILLLDEPFNGLDHIAANLWQLALTSGVSIIISSHQVSGLVEIIDKLY